MFVKRPRSNENQLYGERNELLLQQLINYKTINGRVIELVKYEWKKEALLLKIGRIKNKTVYFEVNFF